LFQKLRYPERGFLNLKWLVLIWVSSMPVNLNFFLSIFNSVPIHARTTTQIIMNYFKLPIIIFIFFEFCTYQFLSAG